VRHFAPTDLHAASCALTEHALAATCAIVRKNTLKVLVDVPPMKRRVVTPWRLTLLLLALAVLPTLVVATRADDAALKSVAHIAISFVALMLAFRIIGKRELSRLSPFELVTLMLIPEILSNSLQGQGSLLASLAGLCTVLFLVVAFSVLSQRFEPIQKLLEAAPTVLVVDGRLLEQNMNRERIAPDELMSEMRKQGLDQLQSVRFAVLESGGNITFVPRDQSRGTPSAEDDGVRP
jgi:uncharacterized membrane protein YcaP (DUF421 family)